MTEFQITIERISDNRRFVRLISAKSADAALRAAMATLGHEAIEYYAIAIVPASDCQPIKQAHQ